MESRSIQIRGSGSALYDVVFTRLDDASPRLRCSCDAGAQKTLCKHVRALLAGDISAVEKPRGDDLTSTLRWLDGSEVAMLAARVEESEGEIERAKAASLAAKKHLGRVLYGR